MRKRYLIPILACMLLLSCCTVAFAHPGATDANGGHYDHSTGEYHYHQGYPAHQHTDGRCPYNYDDRTGQNSGSSSGGNDSVFRPNRRTAPPGYESPKPVEHQKIPRYLPVLLLLSIPVSLIAYKIIKHHVEEQQFRRSGRSRQMARELQEQIDSIRRRRNALRMQLLRQDVRLIRDAVGAPPGAYVDEEGLPHLYSIRSPDIDGCVFAFNSRSGILHRPDCPYAVHLPELNIQLICGRFYPHPRYRGCAFCKPYIPDLSWVPEYQKMLDALTMLNLSERELHRFKPKPPQIEPSAPQPKPVPPPEPSPHPALPREVEVSKPREVKPEPSSKLNVTDTFLYNVGGRDVTLYGVESSCISHVGYIGRQRQLVIRMKSGRVYTYNHVAPELYWKFIHADSIGKFYNKYFKAGRRQP